MEITTDVAPYFEFCLEMECAALEPYLRFVYDDFEQGLAVQRFLGEKGLIESSPPYGRVLLEDGEPIAMVSGIPGADLKRLRLKATYALHRQRSLAPDPATRKRIQLAHEALLVPEDTDYYSSKLGTSPKARGKGAGTIMMTYISRYAKEHEFLRAVGEIASENAPMNRLMLDKVHWKVLRTARVEDPDTGRSLEYKLIFWDCGQEPG